MKSKITPILYILMRTDLDSMNPGKAVAQGVHAGHQFVYRLTGKHNVAPPHEQVLKIDLYDRWKEETGDGFGTTVTLSVTGDMLPKVVQFALLAGFEAGVTHDPTYPIRDGSEVHLVPLDTCGYVFGTKEVLEPLLRQFNLMA